MPLNRLPTGLTPYGSPAGVTPKVQGRGKTFYVSSVADLRADSTAHGDTPLRPFATLDYAVGQTTANRGDVIVVMENHAETVSSAAAISLDVAGISVIGLGLGDDRPTFSFDSSTASTILVGAANIEISNLVFLCNVASNAMMLNIDGSGDGAYIHDNEFREGTATGLTFISMTGVADGVRIENNYFYMPTAANGDYAIRVNSGGAVARLRLIDNTIYGNFDIAAIGSTNNLTEAVVLNNNVVNTLISGLAISLTGTNTGIQRNNYQGSKDTLLESSSAYHLVKAGYDPASDVATTGTAVLFNTTGVIEIQQCYGVCTTAPTSASTIEVGVSSSTALLIAQMTDATQLIANEIWHDATPTTTAENITSKFFVVTGGQDINLTIGSATFATGIIDFYIWWRPISSDGALVAAT